MKKDLQAIRLAVDEHNEQPVGADSAWQRLTLAGS